MDERAPPPSSIPADGWDTTPGSVRVLPTALMAEVRALRLRVNQTSQNSSRPLSSDPPSAPPRPQKPPRGRPRGGQPGHPRQTRPLLPPEQVDAVVPCQTMRYPGCQTPWAADLPDARPVRRTQVCKPPVIRPHVTAPQQHTVCCPACQALVVAPPPARAPSDEYRPRVTAPTSMLHSTDQFSDRACQDLLAYVCGLLISLGSAVTRAAHRTRPTPMRLPGSLLRLASGSARPPRRSQRTAGSRPRGGRRDCGPHWARPAPGLSSPTAGRHALGCRTPSGNCTWRTCSGTCACWPAPASGTTRGRCGCWRRWTRCSRPGTPFGTASPTGPGCRWHSSRCGRRSGICWWQGSAIPGTAPKRFSTDLPTHWETLGMLTRVAGVEPANNAAGRALQLTVDLAEAEHWHAEHGRQPVHRADAVRGDDLLPTAA